MDHDKLIKILNILNNNKTSESFEKINMYINTMETLKNEDSIKKVTLSILAEKMLPNEINKKINEKLLNSKEKNLKRILKQ